MNRWKVRRCTCFCFAADLLVFHTYRSSNGSSLECKTRLSGDPYLLPPDKTYCLSDSCPSSVRRRMIHFEPTLSQYCYFFLVSIYFSVNEDSNASCLCLLLCTLRKSRRRAKPTSIDFYHHIVYPVRSNGALDESLVHWVLRSERGNHILVRMCTLLSMVQHLLHLWESIARVHLWAPFWSSIHCGLLPRDG